MGFQPMYSYTGRMPVLQILDFTELVKTLRRRMILMEDLGVNCL